MLPRKTRKARNIGTDAIVAMAGMPDPEHAQRIIAITDDGDNAVIALRACQAYVRAIAR